MIRIVLAFSVGILIAVYGVFSISAREATVLLLVGAGTFLVLFWVKPLGRGNNLISVLALMLIVLLGSMRAQFFSDTTQPNHLMYYDGKVKNYVARITSSPKEKNKTWQYEVQLDSIHDGIKWHSAAGKVLLYLKKTAQPPFFYGDKLLVHGAPKPIDSSKNPHTFNYERFLRFKNIYHQHIVDTAHIRHLSFITGWDLQYYAHALRSWSARQLSVYISDKPARSVALALTLGLSDGLDNSLREAYAASGVMHVLAVSGLHVGILYGVVILLLLPLKFVSWGRGVTAIASINVLWMYAFLTGLSPSVLRAVTMFSCMALARLLSRNAHMYNTIAVSAFLLLLFNPYLIMSVGFQLSYLALLGIVALYRPMYLLWTPRFALLDWAWGVICVSVAAQLATMAVTIFYFHQFSVYFILANLFVLPAAPLILIGSILVIFTGGISPLASFLGTLLQVIISLLNKAVFFIENLPFSVIDHLYINALQCTLLVGIILGGVLLLWTRKYYYLVMMFVGVLTFTLSLWAHFCKEVLPGRLFVYALPGKTAVEQIEKGRSYFYGDHRYQRSDPTFRYTLLPNHVFYSVCDQCTHNVWLEAKKPVNLFYRNGKYIAVIIGPVKVWPSDIHVDILVIGNQAFSSFKEIQEKIQFSKLILSSSNTKRYCEQMLNDDKNNIIYSVPHRGAYVGEL